jgi:hypothetical protein
MPYVRQSPKKGIALFCLAELMLKFREPLNAEAKSPPIFFSSPKPHVNECGDGTIGQPGWIEKESARHFRTNCALLLSKQQVTASVSLRLSKFRSSLFLYVCNPSYKFMYVSAPALPSHIALIANHHDPPPNSAHLPIQRPKIPLIPSYPKPREDKHPQNVLHSLHHGGCPYA